MGQRMKVWSTEGPVPVSQPPEPYQQKKPPVRSLDLSVRGQRDQVRRKESSEREFSQPGAREHHLRGQNSRESE
jgi:hypothetical protein